MEDDSKTLDGLLEAATASAQKDYLDTLIKMKSYVKTPGSDDAEDAKEIPGFKAKILALKRELNFL